MSTSVQQVESAIKQYQDPYYPEQDWLSRDVVKNIAVDNGKVSLQIGLDYAAAGIEDTICTGVRDCLLKLEGVTQVDIDLRWHIAANKTQAGIETMANVKNIVAIASGKGGVGKSTTAVNLALALVAEGARVGLLDADIYGPSQPMMLGIEPGRQPDQKDGKYFLPIVAHDVQSMSMGYLVTENTPMVWRGPMVSGALQQLIRQTLWDDLDYLIVDMPPGTGDIQLTLSQQVPVTGAVIVTTPQDIALLDAKKGIEMFRKVDIPILGVVENMAMHTCSKCGNTEHLFGEGGGERIALEYEAPLLGSLPLAIEIRKQVDLGNPTVVAEPQSAITATYRDMARKLGANLAKRGKSSVSAFPDITVSDD